MLSDSVAGVLAEMGRSISLSVANEPGTKFWKTPRASSKFREKEGYFISKVGCYIR